MFLPLSFTRCREKTSPLCLVRDLRCPACSPAVQGFQLAQESRSVLARAFPCRALLQLQHIPRDLFSPPPISLQEHRHTEAKSPQRPQFLLNYCHLYFLHVCANRGDRNGGVLKNNKMYLHTFPYVQVNSHK